MIHLDALALLLNLFLCILLTNGLHLRQNPYSHSLYTVEKTKKVGKSASIALLNQCKSDCLAMGAYFPFDFKYHRLVLRQKVGYVKYIEGQCLFTADGNQWYSWKEVKVFIKQTYVMGERAAEHSSEMSRWKEFDQRCENEQLKIERDILESLDFNRVHSDFEYYDNGTFVNLEPFTDLDQLFKFLSDHIS